MRDRTGPLGKPPTDAAEETVERVGDLEVAQPADGYRYGLDPFLLVSFVAPKEGERIVDIGTGCGIIPLLLARQYPSVELTGIELQSDLARLAGENVLRNDLAGRCRIIEGDAREGPALLGDRPFDRVVSNPPFRPPHTGRVCPDNRRALARQEIALTLQDLCRTAAVLLEEGGTVSLIHLPERLAEIFAALAANGLEPKEMRFIHSFAAAPPQMVLLSARRGGRRGIRHHPPLVIYHEDGSYRSETAGLLYGAPED